MFFKTRKLGVEPCSTLFNTAWRHSQTRVWLKSRLELHRGENTPGHCLLHEVCTKGCLNMVILQKFCKRKSLILHAINLFPQQRSLSIMSSLDAHILVRSGKRYLYLQRPLGHYQHFQKKYISITHSSAFEFLAKVALD